MSLYYANVSSGPNCHFLPIGRWWGRKKLDFGIFEVSGSILSIAGTASDIAERLGLRWQSAAATPLFDCGQNFQSGVALCFPPHSKRRLRLRAFAPLR